MASTRDAKEARPVIPFDSEDFEKGAYDKVGDLVDLAIDEGCPDGQCKAKKRKGLCALPSMRRPRTKIPGPITDNQCPPKRVGDDGWPFPDYEWPRPGVGGQIMMQVSILLEFKFVACE